MMLKMVMVGSGGGCESLDSMHNTMGNDLCEGKALVSGGIGYSSGI